MPALISNRKLDTSGGSSTEPPPCSSAPPDAAHRFSLTSLAAMTDEEWPEDPGERVAVLLERVLDELDLDGEVELEEDDDRIEATVVGDEDYGLLIGRRGQTIDALQLLCYQAAFRGIRERKRVVVDVAGYRERRRETLEARADRAAEQAISGERSIELDPMSAQERRVVHEYLKDRAGIETYSEGDEPNRCVIVAPLISG